PIPDRPRSRQDTANRLCHFCGLRHVRRFRTLPHSLLLPSLPCRRKNQLSRKLSSATTKEGAVMARGKLLRNGFVWALTVSLLLGCQASARAGCNNLFGLCHLGCYRTKRCCQVPCPTVCNEACFGYFPTQWQV